jgi:hypothetical protein
MEWRKANLLCPEGEVDSRQLKVQRKRRIEPGKGEEGLHSRQGRDLDRQFKVEIEALLEKVHGGNAEASTGNRPREG